MRSLSAMWRATEHDEAFASGYIVAGRNGVNQAAVSRVQMCLRQILRGRVSPGKSGPKARQILRGKADRTGEFGAESGGAAVHDRCRFQCFPGGRYPRRAPTTWPGAVFRACLFTQTSTVNKLPASYPSSVLSAATNAS